MTITSKVQQQFFLPSRSGAAEQLIRLPPTVVKSYETKGVLLPSENRTTRRRRTNLWTSEEHERFLQGLEQFPKGPWKAIAAIVGSKTTRQTMTHAQKYRQKIHRRRRLEQATARHALASPAAGAAAGAATSMDAVTDAPAVASAKTDVLSDGVKTMSPNEGPSSTSSPSALDDAALLLFADDDDALFGTLLHDTQSLHFSWEEPLAWV